MNIKLFKKKYLIYIFLLLFVIPTINVYSYKTLNVNENSYPENKYSIIIVDINGTTNYSSIQDAVDAASSGDTIQVLYGVYKETIILDKTINLQGIESKDGKKPIIDGYRQNNVVVVNANKCIIEGFNITNSSISYNLYSGLRIKSNKNIIKNNTFSNHFNSIFIEYSEKNIIKNNGFFKSYYGVMACDSDNNTIIENYFASDAAIQIFYHSDNNTIKNNVMHGPFGGVMIMESSYNKICNNIMINKIDSGNASFGLGLQGKCYNNNISNNTISRYLIGLISTSSSYNIIRLNNISENDLFGLMFMSSHNNIVEKNNFIENGKLESDTFEIFPFLKPILKIFLSSHIRSQLSFNKFKENFWDDYIGLNRPKINDPNKDGYGLLPYRVSFLCYDFNPSMKPYKI